VVFVSRGAMDMTIMSIGLHKFISSVVCFSVVFCHIHAPCVGYLNCWTDLNAIWQVHDTCGVQGHKIVLDRGPLSCRGRKHYRSRI